jgi:hypothetical protein
MIQGGDPTGTGKGKILIIVKEESLYTAKVLKMNFIKDSNSLIEELSLW